jgi:4-hydroxy-tetrahydrodipicolinate reductase
VPSPREALRLLVVGGAGRLGRAVLDEAARAAVPATAKARGQAWPPAVAGSVIVDVGHVSGMRETITYCRNLGMPLVYAVSGFDDPALGLLADLARRVPVVLAPNLSVGHWLQCRLIELLARLAHGMEADAAVLERHPRTKLDRPSATAGVLAAEWTAGGGDVTPEVISLRAGHQVSDHTLRLDLAHESVVVAHEVHDIRAAAWGALVAARAAAGAPAGLVRFHQILDSALEPA